MGCPGSESDGSLVASTWSYHDYITIGPGALSDYMAQAALVPERRQRLLDRTRGILRANLPILEEWLRAHGDFFSWTSPEAGAICYVRYGHAINSTDLVNRLREEKSVLLVPGDHFGMDRYLRIGYGEAPAYVTAGLGRVHDLLASLAPAPAARP
jgi:aspartate/methionine/tyrosine aminotransferase